MPYAILYIIMRHMNTYPGEPAMRRKRHKQLFQLILKQTEALNVLAFYLAHSMLFMALSVQQCVGERYECIVLFDTKSNEWQMSAGELLLFCNYTVILITDRKL